MGFNGAEATAGDTAGDTGDPSAIVLVPTLTSRVKIVGLGILLAIVRLPSFALMINVSSVFPGRIWGGVWCLVPLLWGPGAVGLSLHSPDIML